MSELKPSICKFIKPRKTFSSFMSYPRVEWNCDARVFFCQDLQGINVFDPFNHEVITFCGDETDLRPTREDADVGVMDEKNRIGEVVAFCCDVRSHPCLNIIYRKGFVETWVYSRTDGRQLLKSFKTIQSGDLVTCCASNGDTLATGTSLGEICLYNLNGGFCIFSSKEDSSRITCLQFHPRSNILCAGFQSGLIVIVDVFNKLTLAKFKTHLQAVNCLRCVSAPSTEKSRKRKASVLGAPDLGFLLSSSEDSTINIWNLESIVIKMINSEDVSDRNYAGSVGAFDSIDAPEEIPISIHQAKKKAVTSKSKSLLPLNFLPMKQILLEDPFYSFSTFNVKEIDTSSFRHEPETPWVLLGATSTGLIRVIDPLTDISRQKMLEIRTPHKDPSSQVLVLDSVKKWGPYSEASDSESDSRFFLTMGEDCQVVIWSPLSWIPIYTVHGMQSSIRNTRLMLPCLPDETRPIANQLGLLHSSNDSDLRFFDLCRHANSVLPVHDSMILSFDVDMFGCWLVTSAKGGSVKLWRRNHHLPVSEQWKCIYQYHNASSEIDEIAIGQKNTKRCTCQPPQDGEKFPSFLYFAASDPTGFLRFWKLDRRQAGRDEGCTDMGDPQWRVLAHTKIITDVTFSPNDKLVATSSADKSAKVWSSEDGTLLGTCKGHNRSVNCVRFSPAEQVLATASKDCTVKLWNITDFQCLRTIHGHTKGISALSFFPNALQILTGSTDGLIRIFNIRTADCINSFDEHRDKITSLHVQALPGTSLAPIIVSGDEEGKICLWEDFSKEADEEQQEKKRKDFEVSDKISAKRKSGDLFGAISLCFELDRPKELLEIAETESQNIFFKFLSNPENASTDGESDLATGCQNFVKGLEKENLGKLLRYVQELNKNFRTA
eukprot:GHVP01023310.1.p1 GENE.GHVP01023310.1~~GHVP01023310.1.p1  ORF type:complete len:903 (-),score=156.31 GHVP01023310.1:3081-5747(-)